MRLGAFERLGLKVGHLGFRVRVCGSGVVAKHKPQRSN